MWGHIVGDHFWEKKKWEKGGGTLLSEKKMDFFCENYGRFLLENVLGKYVDFFWGFRKKICEKIAGDISWVENIFGKFGEALVFEEKIDFLFVKNKIGDFS